MNFTPELTTFQGVILSADNVHQFCRLSAKGGNEDQINYVVDSILSYLKQRKYILDEKIPIDKVAQIRVFAFYLVLNADLPALEGMVELTGIDSVVWTIPTIPQCLMCELMWKLHMEQFIYEIIAYTCPTFSFQVAAAFIEHFKYFDPLESSDPLKLLASACYTANCRLNVFLFEVDKLSSLAKQGAVNFQNCLKLFTAPPNEHKLNQLNKDDSYKFLGKRLFNMFLLIDECLLKFTSKLEKPPVSDFYEYTYTEGSFKRRIGPKSVCEYNNNVLVECIYDCHTFMLDICKDLVMDVSVDVFCYWSEIEENYKSMQQAVGELCYKVRNKLLTLPSIADHPLIEMTQQISRKPVEMIDMINITDHNIILRNIHINNEDSKEWIKALVHNETVCFNLELLKILETNLDKYDKEELAKFYDKIVKHMDSHVENKDYIEALSLKVFQVCDLTTKYKILDEHFNKFNNNFVDMKVTPDFNKNMIEVFNKLIVSPDADLTDVLSLFIQNPQRVFTKIFLMAVDTSQQTGIMLKVMKLLEKYANFYYSKETQPCIIRITQEIIDKALDNDIKVENFVKFMCGLKEIGIIPGSKLLLLIIMTNIHKSLLKKDSSKISVQVKLLQEAYSLEELLEYRAPMLAMIAQILDVLRWKIITFTSIAPLTIDAILKLQKSLFDSYNGNIPENESRWLKSKLVNMHPLNMYYYKSLWNPPGNNFLEVVSAMKIEKDMSTDELTSWLSQVLSSCTQQEWYEIWDSLCKLEESTAFKSIQDALVMITLAERGNRTDNTWACLMHAYKIFVLLIRYKYLKEPLTDDRVKETIFNLSTLTELISEDKMEEFGAILMPLFSYLSEKQNDYTVNISEYMRNNLNNTPLWALVNKVFSNGSA